MNIGVKVNLGAPHSDAALASRQAKFSVKD